MSLDLANWESQARKGLLELVLLALLKRGECYGYELVRAAQEALNQRIVEGTIYPILARLHRDGLISHRWSTDETAQPRKYYTLTAAGLEAHTAMRDLWLSLTAGLDPLLRERT